MKNFNLEKTIDEIITTTDPWPYVEKDLNKGSVKKRQSQREDYMYYKYHSAYIGAIAKLNAPNRFDEKGLLKHEYELTDAEKDALKYYVPVKGTSINNDVNGRKIR